MQLYQDFWHNELPIVHAQLVVDWDTFINHFSHQVLKHASIQLNHNQKQYLHQLLDADNRGQVYKSGYLLLIRDFWSVPSNRTKLFKMKMNLSAMFPKVPLLTTIKTQRVQLRVEYSTPEMQRVSQCYEYQHDQLHLLNTSGHPAESYDPTEKGFISIGSAADNDIRVECLSVNSHHLKVIGLKKKIKVKREFEFVSEHDTTKYKEVTVWFIRDIAKSRRAAYALDTAHKYVILKKGMVVNLGLSDEFSMIINQVGPSHATDYYSPKTLNNLDQLINAHRINYLGEIDAKIPKKTVLNLDTTEVTAKDVDQMFAKDLYYPPVPTEMKKLSEKDDNTVSLAVYNCTNEHTKHYKNLSGEISIGRDPCSTVSIDSTSIRKAEAVIFCVANIWLLRCADDTLNGNIDQPISVNLATKAQQTSLQNSNRIWLEPTWPTLIQIKSFKLTLTVQEQQHQQQD